MLKKIIYFKLKFVSRLILNKYQPKIIAITGSHGKTSAKEACYYVLRKKYEVRRPSENFNNEFGVPFVIIGVDSPGHNPAKWPGMFLKAWGLILFKQTYPQVLILEMGADRPGDIKYLMSFIKPDIGVLTGIGRSHIEFFGTVNKICEEKSELLKNIKPGGQTVLNIDDAEVCDCVSKVPSAVKTIRAGFSASADLRGVGLRYLSLGQGLEFSLAYQQQTVTVKLPLVSGASQAISCALAAGVGLSMGLSLAEISQNLFDFKPPKSRMNLIKGIKNSWILDDTYNASPHSTVSGLEALKVLAGMRRTVFILGDMLELGEETENAHRGLARKFADWLGFLVTVGDRANFTSQEASKLGMPETKIKEYNHLEPLLSEIESIIKSNDLIYIKGSQGARMEKVVKDIMAEPLRAEELVVRQSAKWLKS